MPVLRLRRRGWLFWEDLACGANFSHPSVLLVLDDRPGQVIERVNLDMYPGLPAGNYVLNAKVEVETTERFCGTDCAWRDPFGNLLASPSRPTG
jgi:hypothetical protein